MDENLLNLLEELSLRTSFSEDENSSIPGRNGDRLMSSGYTSQASNFSSPTYDQIDGGSPEKDIELENTVDSLFQEIYRPNQNTGNQQNSSQQRPGYDKTKLLVALLGNIDLVKCAIKKINHLVTLGKKMEQIYRLYYMDPNVSLDLHEISSLINSFSGLYNAENYIREVNICRMYQAYCKKLIEIYNVRTNQTNQPVDEQMIT